MIAAGCEENSTTSSSEDLRGLLIPIANPEGVGPLLTVAFAASETDDPPPRVIALVSRRDRNAAARLAEGSQEVPPGNAALKMAVEYARAHGVVIEPQALWSDNPASDIVAAASAAQVAWIILGYHRAHLGRDTMGGVVREVFVNARAAPINVAVFIHGTDRPIERIFVAVDAAADGRAALDLAVRVAQRNRCKLRALLVPAGVVQPANDLADMIQQAKIRTGSLLHSDVLSERSLKQLFRQTPGHLLIVGRKFAEEVGLPLDEVPGANRCVMVVRGAVAPERGKTRVDT